MSDESQDVVGSSKMRWAFFFRVLILIFCWPPTTKRNFLASRLNQPPANINRVKSGRDFTLQLFNSEFTLTSNLNLDLNMNFRLFLFWTLYLYFVYSIFFLLFFELKKNRIFSDFSDKKYIPAGVCLSLHETSFVNICIIYMDFGFSGDNRGYSGVAMLQVFLQGGSEREKILRTLAKLFAFGTSLSQWSAILPLHLPCVFFIISLARMAREHWASIGFRLDLDIIFQYIFPNVS